MNIHHRWLKEDRVAYFEVEGDVLFEELAELNSTIKSYLDSESSDEIDCVFVTENMGAFPTNVFKVNRVVDFQKHPSLGWIYLVTDNRTVNFISVATSQITSTRQKTVRSMDELYAILARFGVDVTAS